jgi:hypothetical protein
VKISAVIAGGGGDKTSKFIVTVAISAPSVTLNVTGYVLVTSGAVVVGVPESAPVVVFREIPGGRGPALTSTTGDPTPKKFTPPSKLIPTVAVRVSPFVGEEIVGGGVLPVSCRISGTIFGFAELNAVKFPVVTQAIGLPEIFCKFPAVGLL